MAYVTAHGKRIKVRFRIRGAEYVTTINFNPTQANLRAARSRCRDLEARLRAGEPWEDIRGELREERGVRARTLGQYMQHYFDTAQDIERTTLVKYLETYNRVWSVFDGRDIATIRKPELLKRLATFRYSAKMRRNAISVLRKGFDVAKEEGYLSSAPTDHWKLSRCRFLAIPVPQVSVGYRASTRPSGPGSTERHQNGGPANRLQSLSGLQR